MPRPHRLGVASAFVLLAGCAGTRAPEPDVRGPAPPPLASGPAVTTAVPAPPQTTPEAAAEPPAPAGFLRPCRSGSPELAAAESEVDAIDRAVGGLDPAADPKPIVTKLEALLDGPCFALAEDDDRSFDRGLSLRAWWDGGGEDWVRHFLRLGDGPGTPNAPVWSWVAPTPRKSLTREALGDPRLAGLAPLLCPAGDDGACGRETRGWLLRARRASEAHARARLSADVAGIADPLAHCRGKARAASPPLRYDAWRACLDTTTTRTDELPLGQFRAPKEGWLVLRGRRGHYAYCDEVRAYDLATGSAWVRATCSNLALRDDGSVDLAASSARSKPVTLVGRVPIDGLREAALVTFLSPHAQPDVVREGYARALPEDVTPMRQAAVGRGLGFTASWSSAQTTLAWSWIVKGKPVLSGDIIYPEHHDDAVRDHAVSLLTVAEAAFTPLEKGTCVPATPPSPLPLTKPTPGVAPIDGTLDPNVARSERPFDDTRALGCAR